VGDDGGPLPSTPEERICSSTLALTGTFMMTSGVPDIVNNDTNLPPADGMLDFTGCWPTGVWTFSATVGENSCATPPVPEPTYKFTGTYVPDDNMEGPKYDFVLDAPALTENFRLKVSSGGGGLCEGVIEIYTNGGKNAWILHPTLNVFNMSGPLAGEGEYSEYPVAVYP
jgi:hypothetical protein